MAKFARLIDGVTIHVNRQTVRLLPGHRVEIIAEDEDNIDVRDSDGNQFGVAPDEIELEPESTEGWADDDTGP